MVRTLRGVLVGRVLPDTVVHADWSVAPAKRWACVAQRCGDGYVVDAVVPVPDGDTLLASADTGAGGEQATLLGVDVPIGLPLAYARRAGIVAFAPWVRGVSDADFGRWRLAAASPAEVTMARPFYPARPGGARRAHLVEGLGVGDFDELLRTCDRSPPLARPAASLFWTLGANQVGKAAVSLWDEVLRRAAVQLWPFDGPLDSLATAGGLTVVEASPAQLAHRLGVPFGFRQSKRRQLDRAALAPHVLAAAARLGVELSPTLRAHVADGFGGAPTGEDAYDALIGALGMLAVLRGGAVLDPPVDAPHAWSVEGWILGA